jgi:hypothetical protein
MSSWSAYYTIVPPNAEFCQVCPFFSSRSGFIHTRPADSAEPLVNLQSCLDEYTVGGTTMAAEFLGGPALFLAGLQDVLGMSFRPAIRQ